MDRSGWSATDRLKIGERGIMLFLINCFKCINHREYQYERCAIEQSRRAFTNAT